MKLRIVIEERRFGKKEGRLGLFLGFKGGRGASIDDACILPRLAHDSEEDFTLP